MHTEAAQFLGPQIRALFGTNEQAGIDQNLPSFLGPQIRALFGTRQAGPSGKINEFLAPQIRALFETGGRPSQFHVQVRF